MFGIRVQDFVFHSSMKATFSPADGPLLSPPAMKRCVALIFTAQKEWSRMGSSGPGVTSPFFWKRKDGKWYVSFVTPFSFFYHNFRHHFPI